MKAHISFSHSYRGYTSQNEKVLQRTMQRQSLNLNTSEGGRYLFSLTQARRGLGIVVHLNLPLNTFSPPQTLFERSLEDSNINTFQYFIMFTFTSLGLQKFPPETKQIILLETTRSQTHRRLTSRSCLSVVASSFPISSLF